MSQKKETVITKDAANKKLLIVREFEAPVDQVWDAWTQSELLDQWWPPKPYKAVTKSMDFREGGFWLYYMKGPEGDIHWCRADYSRIVAQKEFEYKDAFCDEKGTPIDPMPNMHWVCNFALSSAGTKVSIELTFQSDADIERIIEMGFKEGFAAAHNNLDELLAAQ